ncbi:ECF-type sigma factor [Roseimaritima sediminicola]|uniref:ECF-type sigma factor n=1 Tax=Roseimaritima sediminicola TaxID=2662066 RepID=UPI0012982A9F|nr:ECF-type sigma factor [Roseimaritima sediminicola]
MESVTDNLLKATRGQPRAADELFTAMYDDLQRMAGRFIANEPNRNRLTSSSLVHEAYMRMIDQRRVDWQGRTHFFAIGARVMRRILVDHARRVNSQKRGGGWSRGTLDESVTFQLERDEDVLLLDELLSKLKELDSRQATVVELKFFGGLAMKEIACELGTSLRTIEKDWTMARAWLRREMKRIIDS